MSFSSLIRNQLTNDAHWLEAVVVEHTCCRNSQCTSKILGSEITGLHHCKAAPATAEEAIIPHQMRFHTQGIPQNLALVYRKVSSSWEVDRSKGAHMSLQNGS